MDIKAYIASDILEQYVLGAATAEQAAEVVRLSAMYPEIRAELEEIENALFKYAEAQQMTPPASVKASLFARLDSEMTDVSQHEAPTGKIVPMDSAQTQIKSGDTARYLVAASVVLLIASTIVNIWLYNKWQNTETALVAANSDKQLMADNNRKMEASYKSLDQNMQALLSPDIKPVTMKGLPAVMPEALATVYWNTKNNEVFLNVKQLADAPTDQQYQLWAIVDGVPVDAGVFDSKDAIAGIIKMKNMHGASAFAVSVEKRGGNPTPTKVVLMGAVPPSEG